MDATWRRDQGEEIKREIPIADIFLNEENRCCAIGPQQLIL
jgi:hypothetical protein